MYIYLVYVNICIYYLYTEGLAPTICNVCLFFVWDSSIADHKSFAHGVFGLRWHEPNAHLLSYSPGSPSLERRINTWKLVNLPICHLTLIWCFFVFTVSNKQLVAHSHKLMFHDSLNRCFGPDKSLTWMKNVMLGSK